MRELGYYWVKYQNEWEVALYRLSRNKDTVTYHWTLNAFVDDSWWFNDSDFEEIDERRIERSE